MHGQQVLLPGKQMSALVDPSLSLLPQLVLYGTYSVYNSNVNQYSAYLSQELRYQPPKYDLYHPNPCIIIEMKENVLKYTPSCN